MRRTRSFLALALAISMCGCGAEIVTTTVTEARQACDEFEILGSGETSGLFDSFIIEAQALRDDGLIASFYISAKIELCREIAGGTIAENACFNCVTFVADLVWN